MGETAKYVYGVINSSTRESFSLSGIVGLEDAPAPMAPAEAVSRRGILDRAYTITFRDICAVVTDSQIVDCAHAPKTTLARLLIRHQQVIERVMNKHTIIPMKLGTFAGSAEEVQEILAKGYRAIQDIFARAKGTIEIDVTVTLNDFDSFLRDVSEHEEIRGLRESLVEKPGGVTVDDQMQIGVLLKRCADKEREEYARQVLLRLSGMAQEYRTHDLMDDRMVLNTAFLIRRSDLEAFEQEVDRLNGQFQEKFRFRCVGPLPPYSFYTLEVKKAKPEEIDWARKELGLTSDFVTAKDLKKAHLRLALTCHPDKHPGTPGIEKKFADMTRAYKILLDYYRASGQTGQADGCSFNDEALEDNAILVTTSA